MEQDTWRSEDRKSEKVQVIKAQDADKSNQWAVWDRCPNQEAKTSAWSKREAEEADLKQILARGV